MSNRKASNALLWGIIAAAVLLAVFCIVIFRHEAAPVETVIQAEPTAAAVPETTLPQPEETAAPETEATEPETTVPPTEPPKAVLQMEKLYSIGPDQFPRNMVASITFVDSLSGAPSDAWDISKEETGTILAWLVPSAEESGMRDLYIGSAQQMYAANGLSFEYFDRVKRIDFAGLLDTSELTSCAGMFQYTGYLNGGELALDLSGWDLSGVTSLAGMFYGCGTLASVDMTGWNVSAVTNCDDMFLGCKNLKQLDIADWQLGKDCSKLRMITDCPALGNAAALAKALNVTVDLTQDAFPQDRLSDLTIPEMELAVGNSQIPFPKRNGWKMEYSGQINGVPVYNEGEGWAANLKGDLGERYDAYNKLDLDHDGKRDYIEEVATDDPNVDTFLMHFGNGQILPLEVTSNHGLGCCSCAFFFSDINGTGNEDILAVQVHRYMGHGGTKVNFQLFTDTKGANPMYHRQALPNLRFTLQGLQDEYVRVSCSSLNYYEAFHIGGSSRSNDPGKTTIEHYFGSRASEDYRVQCVKIEGDKLIILYNFHSAVYGLMSENPFGLELQMMPGGYFNVSKVGTSVIRDSWLNS